MAEVRKKIQANPVRPLWLVTEPGVGYRIREAMSRAGKNG